MSRSKELPVLEQIVPSAACFQCDVCCRFPEADSSLRPYFTREEIEAAIAAGVLPDAFPDTAGSKVTLRPYGEGYICPAFDPGTGRCGIYSIRPLDCQLYPIAVMWDDNRGRVVMGWDRKCPYIVKELENSATRSYVERTAAWLESDPIAPVFIANPQLVGAYQEDVAVLRPLPRISEGLRESYGAGGAGAPVVNAVTRQLTLDDRRWVEAKLLAHAPPEPLAAYSFQYHFVWQDLFRYEWVELHGHCCLLARDQEGSFLALPPLGPDPYGPVMAEVFSLLAQANRNHSMSRIENVPRSLADRCQVQGYRVLPKEGDYLYERESLVALKGNHYKGQRAAYNHCLQHARPSFRPYEPADMEACLRLFERWRGGVKEDESGYARHMAIDAASVHRFVLHHAADLGLMGRVVEGGGQVSAYTFGYPLTSLTFCILLEIADRTVKGLPQYIFREFCRELGSYRFINAMDDSGLAGLRYAKELYRPVRLIESFIVTPAPA